MSLARGLERLQQALAPLGVLIAAKVVEAGDEAAFHDAAQESTAQNLPRRRASGAARILAARLMPRLGVAGTASVGRMANGAPAWPPGILGSIAHDEQTALVALARSGGPLAALGADIEPSAPLPEDVYEFVVTAAERRFCPRGSAVGRLAFAAKEAVYKAIHPLDGSPLEYADIECAEDFRFARLADGRRLSLFWIDAPRIVVIAALVA